LSKAILTLLLQEQSIPIVLSGRDLMVVLKQEQEKKVHLPYQLFINYTELLVLQRKKPCLSGNAYQRISSANGQSFDTYAKYTNLTQHDFGGVSQNPQVDTLKMGLTF
jgi:hypothetical protein